MLVVPTVAGFKRERRPLAGVSAKYGKRVGERELLEIVGLDFRGRQFAVAVEIQIE